MVLYQGLVLSVICYLYQICVITDFLELIQHKSAKSQSSKSFRGVHHNCSEKPPVL